MANKTKPSHSIVITDEEYAAFDQYKALHTQLYKHISTPVFISALRKARQLRAVLDIDDDYKTKLETFAVECSLEELQDLAS